MTSGIYIIRSPSSKIYIGSAVDFRTRWHGHKIELRRNRHKNPKLQNAWNKYGEDNISFSILLICDKLNLLMYEQIAIDAMEPEYNICKIAGNTLGLKWSYESRVKQAARIVGTKDSIETKAKKSAALTGRRVSEETRRKIAAQKGWKHSEETKIKMRGRQISVEQREIIRQAQIGNSNRKGSIVPLEIRDRISAKLKGRTRSPEAIAKQRETWAAKRMARR